MKNYAVSDTRIWSSCADFVLTRLNVKNVYGVLKCVAGTVLLILTQNVKLTTVNRSPCVPLYTDLSSKPQFP